MTVFLKTFFENEKSIFSHKPFYDKQKNWTKTNSQVSTATAIQNPFTFYYVSEQDWSTTHNYQFWNKNFATNSDPGIINTVTLKTVYDPSVSNFVLPSIAAFSNFTTTGANTTNTSEFNVNGSFDKGWNFYKSGISGSTFFFEALGFRDTYSGRPTGTGAVTHDKKNGYYWVNGAYSISRGRLLSFSSSDVYPQNWLYRSLGYNVRPVLE